ncbi:hypothetical protein [Phytoactinopolyspora limicola]|uniref:hypothetical protein n=1 Tax=Phytoactinopolyspora limicola TaxID=2715536 RepID=UPI001409B4E5|nr:hypothetical protein [Phytoactinopolyspora limicola]
MCVTVALLVIGLTGCGADDSSPEAGVPGTGGPTEPTHPQPTEDTVSPDENERSPAPDPTTPDTPENDTTPDPGTGHPDPTPPDRLTPAPTAPPPVTGEVPAEFLDEVIADAAGRSGVDVGGVTVVRAQAVQWPDGSLGCPEPGQMYTQAIVDGYWVELDAGGEVFDYRLNDQGMVKLCTSPMTPPGADIS